MKAGGCLFALFVIVLIACFGALYALRQLRPSTFQTDPHKPPVPLQPPEPETPPTADPDRYKDWVDSLREFRKQELPDSYRVFYGFIDHSGATHRIQCDISKADHERETNSFGYVKSEIQRELERRLQPVLDREIERRGLKEYYTVTVYDGGGYQWHSRTSSGVSEETYAVLSARMDEMEDYLKTGYKEMVNKVKAEVYASRGFYYANRMIRVDHGGMVIRNQLPLSDCFGALRRAARGYNERQYLGLYLAFFQEIRYELPPNTLHGKETVGLYVPTEVLINNHGDCDSKSLAFSAMMRSMMKSVLVVDLPDHVLVAVETRPGPGHAFVRLGNRYFVICEVAGPGKFAPGKDPKGSASGYFDYTLIEPATSDLLRGSQNERSASP